ncbi:M15 family peptidase [Paenibacillus sp. LMG 31459]|uniref:M15 family peptidase n=1 Tax=Paenibacillus phytohabitans TaxID=2654978 RepID=A0ABX1YVP8_9BACL|nr:M15 family metallopeptidase [Paenibacillus phytohabitans]NOU83843.1 M15 family peptidase [Paenibacillus phytohabitans]
MLTLDQVKLKSVSKLSGLQPVIAAGMIALITGCYNRGVQIIITQGLRTKAEQDNLYAKGRTAKQLAAVGLSHVIAQPKEDIVTNARGGYSNHNYGWAIDFALLLPDGRTVSWDMLRDDDKDSLPDWSEVVEEAKRLGFSWGGDWRTFTDMPHLEMVFGLTTSQLREGKKPAVSLITKAFAVIDKYMEEAEEDMSRIEALVKELESTVAGLTNSKDVLKQQSILQAGEIKELSALLLELTDTNPPAWAEDALKAFANTPSVLNGKPVIDTPDKATYAEARLITILYRLGLAAQQKGGK